MNQKDKIFEKFLEAKIYKKLIGLLNRKGYKAGSIKLLNTAMLILVKKTGFSFSYLVWKIFKKLQTWIEVRNVLVKGKRYLVPFKITYNRRIYLVIKWLLKAIMENKTKKSISNIIMQEFLLICLNKKSKALRYKEKNYKAALISKANLHYRW